MRWKKKRDDLEHCQGREIGDWTVALMMAMMSLSINWSFKYGITFLASKAVSVHATRTYEVKSGDDQTNSTDRLTIYIYNRLELLCLYAYLWYQLAWRIWKVTGKWHEM